MYGAARRKSAQRPFRAFRPAALTLIFVIAACHGCGDNSSKSKPVASSPNSKDAAEPATKKSQTEASAKVAVKDSAVENSAIRTSDGEAPESPTTKTAPQAAGGDASKATQQAGSKSSPPPATEYGNSPPKKPATVEEARAALDLTKFPLPEGAKAGGVIGGQAAIAHVDYKLADGDVKSALEYVRKYFTGLGWKEVGETFLTDESAYCTFAGKGFVATVSVSTSPMEVGVSISNQSNVDLSKLPVPPKLKLHHAGPTSVSYFTEQSPEDAREAVDKLLTEQGWQPYGANLDNKNYKQNAVLLSASVNAVPVFDNKTMISYLARQMSAELPAPPQAIDADYTDHMNPPKQLWFESGASRDEIYQFYRDTLGKEGWKPTTENPITDRYKAFMIFRNEARDLMELETENPREGKIRGKLKHQTAEEVAEIERRIEEERPRIEAELKKKQEDEDAKRAQREKERKEKEAAEKARRRVVVAVPAGAKDVKFETDEIKFATAPGKARAAAEAIAKQFRDAGWKQRGESKPDIVGTYHFEKDDQSLHIIYQDPRISPPEVRVTGFRVDFVKPDDAKK